MRKNRTLIAVAAGVLLLPGLLVACSGGAAEDEETPSAGATGATAAECMRGKGYDMPDVTVGGKGLALQPPEAADDEQWAADMTECADADGAAGQAQDAEGSPESAEEMREMAECMRENGFADYPDDAAALETWEPDDATAFDRVADECMEHAR